MPERATTGSPGIRYRDAGVDRDAAARAKARIADVVAATRTPGVLSQPGGFGGLFRAPSGLRDPVLVASADGVGTKLKVAMRANRHDTVGEDLVNHCVDDILVEGARPLFFLDYIGMGQLEEGTVAAVVEGIGRGCRANGCALLGGETAEMPDFYAPGEYDLAGFVVGAVEGERRPGAERVRSGDVLIGLPGTGFHTNGYSLLRRILFERLALGPDDRFPDLDASVADVLLRVHPSYLEAVAPLLDEDLVHALAHITGGGIPENLARVVPDGLSAHVRRDAWRPPPEFGAVQRAGQVPEEEMFRTFNMGIGMILAVAPADCGAALERLAGSATGAHVIGEVAAGERRVVLD